MVAVECLYVLFDNHMTGKGLLMLLVIYKREEQVEAANQILQDSGGAMMGLSVEKQHEVVVVKSFL